MTASCSYCHCTSTAKQPAGVHVSVNGRASFLEAGGGRGGNSQRSFSAAMEMSDH